MKNTKQENNDSGVIMLESLIVFTVTIFLLFFVLAAFSTMFQRFNIQIIANETAARLAQTYEYSINSDTLTGEISLSDVASVDPYRYHNEELMKSATKRKASEYATSRLKKTTFTKDVDEPVVSAEIIGDALGRRHIVVEIAGRYSVPFGDMLGYFGYDSISTYKTTAYADCVDLSNYINTIGFVDNWTSLKQLNSKFIKMTTNVLKLFKNIGDLF